MAEPGRTPSGPVPTPTPQAPAVAQDSGGPGASAASRVAQQGAVQGTAAPTQAGPIAGDRGSQTALAAAGGTPAAPAAAAPATDVRAQIMLANPGGVVVAVYAAYASGVHDAAEFQRRAAEFATLQNAVGINAQGQLVVGQPVSVTAVEQVGERVQQIHRLLAGPATPAAPAADTTAPAAPRAAVARNTQIRSLAMFAHGEPHGIGMDAGNRFTTRSTSDRAGGAANTDTAARTTSESVRAFATSIAGAVTPDIRVQLFACSAGRDSGQTEQFADWRAHAEGERRGQDSFASELAEALGPEASVYAHTTTGHTTENYAARVFGAEAGGGQGGIQVFERIFPRAFIEAEVLRPAVQQRLHANPGPPQNAAADYTLVREAMFAHFRRSIGPGLTIGGRPIGQEMMVNPANAATLMQADWTTRFAQFLQPAPAPRR